MMSDQELGTCHEVRGPHSVCLMQYSAFRHGVDYHQQEQWRLLFQHPHHAVRDQGGSGKGSAALGNMNLA